MNFNRSWFPGSSSANNFGWDPLTKSHNDASIWPRIHLANDYWPTDGKHLAHPISTIVSGPMTFINNDGTGNSILKQTAGDFEVMYYHLYREELSAEIIAACTVPNTFVQAGTAIGPVGDVGIGHGRHVHLVIRAKPYVNLEPLLGPGWDENRFADLAAQYGPVFIEKANAPTRQIIRMNKDIIFRHAGYNGPLWSYINPARVLG